MTSGATTQATGCGCLAGASGGSGGFYGRSVAARQAPYCGPPACATPSPPNPPRNPQGWDQPRQPSGDTKAAWCCGAGHPAYLAQKDGLELQHAGDRQQHGWIAGDERGRGQALVAALLKVLEELGANLSSSLQQARRWRNQ